jgi:hypothetical protein
MTSEEDWREVEQLQQEAEQLKSYLERPDISSKEKLERAIEVRERHLKVLSERRRNRPRIRLAPLPPQLLQHAGAAPTTAKEEVMTYEQMETTMQFILEQQAASSERQKQFEENLARINDTFAASADWQKRFEENLARINDSIAASTDSTTPASAPFQPACAAPMIRPSGSASRIGAQSAVRMPSAMPGRSVAMASALGLSGICHGAVTVTASALCTW